MTDAEVFEQLESEVRSYCRLWPAVFSVARGSHIYDEHGRDYLDFFSGAGALNYGHNHPRIKEPLLRYLQEDSVVHSLDMYTVAKRQFIEAFQHSILAPRGLAYKIQFPGPAGSTAIEAALKLARKYTGRRTVVTFSNAFHGMTLGALSVNGMPTVRHAPGVPSGDTVILPYNEWAPGAGPGTLLLDSLLDEGCMDLPAAVIVEAVQGEGGMTAASPEWLRELSRLCQRRGVLLIWDDVQMGCGRTGQFFSFEQAGVHPDLVCLSKSLSGYGLPLALTLLRPELDVWAPGEHTGTFRGPNPAFITAVAAMGFWQDEAFLRQAAAGSLALENAVRAIAIDCDGTDSGVRGRGLAWGIALRDPGLARRAAAAAFDLGVLLETSADDGSVLKFMPPLTTTDAELSAGLEIVSEALARAARPGAAVAEPAGALG